MPSTEEQIKELQKTLGGVHESFKTWATKEEKERKDIGSAAGETKAALGKTQEALDKISDQIKALEVKVARADADPAGGSEGTNAAKKKIAEHKAAFYKAARMGNQVLTPEELSLVMATEKGLDAIPELKALTLANDPSGGYLAAPPDLESGILKDIIEVSPLRGLARVRTTSRRSVQVRKRTGTFAAQWVGETDTRTETTGLAYGLDEMPVNEAYALVDISTLDLEDSAFNLENELRQEFAEQFGLAEGTAFISGNSVKRPEGILTPTIGEVNSGVADAITADGMVDLWTEPKTAYARNGTFIFRRTTLRALRKLKDGTGQYLWQPGLATGMPNTVLGSPYVEMPDMPAIAANAFPVAFGDFRRAYLIADRVAIMVIRDNLTQATSGMVRFIARKRVGGMVVQTEAIKKLKIAV